MTVCELDQEVSGDILGWKIPAWQALLVHRVLPSFGGLILYLIVMCFDIALIYEHYRNGQNALAVFCLLLIVLPAAISLVFTLASPPRTLQVDGSSFSINIGKVDLKWMLAQFAKAVFFPVSTVGRYSYLIFWWVEAVFASRSHDEHRTKEALTLARAPSSLELYLFLQAFVHSAPYAIVNILDMMANSANPIYDKIQLQAVTLVASSLRMASIATTYRRFEREKICGRRYPWSTNIDDEAINNEETPDDYNTDDNIKSIENEPIYEPLRSKQDVFLTQRHSINPRNQVNSDLIQFSPRHSERNSYYYDDFGSESDTISSDYLPPINRKRSVASTDEYERPLTIIDRVAPRRRDTIVVEEVNVPPPPVTPAPRPGSLAVWAEKMVENAESIPAWLSAPPRRKHIEIIHDEPDLPQRVPRSFKRGLEPQDATAAFVHFLGWHGFFIARLLSLAALMKFSPFFSIIILFIHYQIMLLFLIIPQASTLRRAFYIFLAFIYLFCLMEFKIRFRHVRVWHASWFFVSTVEIIAFISLWATIENPLHFWWKNYVIILTLASLALSYMLFLTYFLILQPRETIIYQNRIKK